MSVTHQADHAGAAVGRLLEQFKDRPNFLAFIRALVTGIQDLEDVFYDLITKRLLTATGVQLDVLGKIVGQSRGADADDIYLSKILARILANRSSGTREDITAVLRAVLGLGGRLIWSDPSWYGLGVAEFSVRAWDVVVSDDTGAALVEFLRDAKLAGVRAILEWSTVAKPRTFRFCTGCFISSTAHIGDTVVHFTRRVTRFTTDALAPSGFVIVGDPTASDGEGPKAYTLDTGGQSITLSVALAKNHSVNDILHFLRNVVDDSYGFGDSSDPTIGGELATARSAT